jgi:hypothetical protein
MTEEHDGNLDTIRKWYEKSGDKSTILFGIGYCCSNNQPPPPWLAAAFLEAFRRVQDREVASWDDVFGRPLRKHERLDKIRRDREKVGPLLKRILERRRAGEAIDKRLFDEVGGELGIGGSTSTETLYYEFKKQIEAAPDYFPYVADLKSVIAEIHAKKPKKNPGKI